MSYSLSKNLFEPNSREKSFSWANNSDDRFIPNRKITNASDFQLHQIEENLDSSCSSVEKDNKDRTYS